MNTRESPLDCASHFAKHLRIKSLYSDTIAVVRLLSLTIVVMVFTSCIVLTVGSDDSDAIDNYGSCGTTTQYLYDPLKTELTIFDNPNSGTGIMWDKNKIDDWPWNGVKDEITSIFIDERVTHLGDFAFSNLPNLVSVRMGPDVTSIGKYCFSDDDDLATLELPATLTSIGEGAFKDTTKITSMVIPDSVTTLGSYLFMSSGIEEVTLPSGLTSIPHHCFSLCEHLSTVIIPDSITSIGDSAFQGCDNLSYLRLPDGLTSIGAQALYACNNLSYIHFSSSLSSLGSDVTAKNFYHYGSVGYLEKSAPNLRGHTFIKIGERLTLVSDSLVVNGSAIAIAADAGSINVKASDIAYARQSADSDSSTTFSANLSGGASASFDSSAIQNLAISDAALTVSQISKDSLDDATKELVGDNPVYDISFGSNTDFGDGKMTVTLPYVLPDGKSADDLRVFCVKDGKVSETIGCSYADGKVTFSTGHLSTYYIGFSSSGGPSDNGGFPLWAIAVIIVVAAVGVFAFLFFQKGGFPPLKGLKMPLPHVGSKSSDGAQTDAPAQEEIRQEPVQEPAPATYTSVADESASEEKKDE